jgi:5'-3' exonuclease
MTRRAWLVDASIYIFRAWFSMPDRWHSPDGLPLNAVVGYSGFLYQLIQRLGDSTHLAVAFDESLGSCFRNRIYPDYKCSRALPDEALAFQLATCRELCELLGLPCYGGPEYEADDYLASLGRVCREAGLPVTLVSRDKDLGQLLQEGDELWDFAADARLDPVGFAGRFGVGPAQFADFQALVGDSVDDIPGVPGVGPRTAAQLLSHFPDLESLERNLPRLAELPLRGARGLQQRLQENWPQVQLSRQLVQLEARVPGIEQPPRWDCSGEHLEALAGRLEQLGLGGQQAQRWRRLADAKE